MISFIKKNISNIREENADKGSVSVYIIMIFSVVCILIAGLMALSGYQAEKTNALLSLDIAVESAFSKYFRPLTDNYGMYYYISSDDEALDADIMTYFVKNQEGISKMLSIIPSYLDVYETKYALDDEAENVRTQMKNVIKDTLAEDAINSLISTFKGIEKNNTDNNKELDSFGNEVDKAEAEAKKEEDMLKLLKAVEGITVSGGKINCSDYYAKSGLIGEVTSSNAGIDSMKVWEKVKTHSWDMTEYIISLNKKAKKGIDGKKVSYSVRKAKEWQHKVNNILEKTKEARKLASGIKGIKNAICDVNSVGLKLAENESILNELLELGNISTPQSTEDWENVYSKTSQCIEMLESYHVKDINFDYSTINLKKADDPTKNAGGNINDMLSFLIGDSQKISEKQAAESGIYEKIAEEENKKEKGSTKEKGKTNNKNTESDQLDFSEVSGVDSLLKRCKGEEDDEEKNDEAMTNIYVNLYIEKLLKEYECKEKKNKNKDKDKIKHVLDYEKEYIINAGLSDRENLKAVANRILFIRTGTSLVYLVCNSEARNMAYATAACLVGFTGLDALVRCVQYMILAAWAYEDACVDTGAVLAGHTIPVVKKSGNLNIRYEEMLLFSKEYVQKKINSYKESKGMSYKDYIRLFIMIMPLRKTVYRCMDVIQLNMKQNYDRMFSFQRAIYGADIRLTCDKPFFTVTESGYSYR